MEHEREMKRLIQEGFEVKRKTKARSLSGWYTKWCMKKKLDTVSLFLRNIKGRWKIMDIREGIR